MLQPFLLHEVPGMELHLHDILLKERGEGIFSGNDVLCEGACLLGERHVGRGVGSSKKEAEAAAAQEALKNLGYVKVAGADESPVVEGLDAQGDASPTDGE